MAAGSWLGLPELGISELFGGNQGSVGGVNASNPSAYKAAQTAAYQPKVNTSSTLGLATTNLPSKSTYSGYLSGGQPSQVFDKQVDNAKEEDSIDREGINNMYDEVNNAYNSQLPEVDRSLSRSVGLLQSALEGVQNEAGRSKVTAQQGFDNSVQEASDTASSVQRKNRNVLRALGILGSSAAGELLSAPMNEFDKQRATLQQSLNTRVAQLDDFLNQKTNEHANQIAELTDKYTSLKNNILSDIRYNEKERKNALKGAKAALTSRVTDIRNMQMQYETEVANQKATLGSQWGALSDYATPKADTDAIKTTTADGGKTGGNQAYVPIKKKSYLTEDNYGMVV